MKSQQGIQGPGPLFTPRRPCLSRGPEQCNGSFQIVPTRQADVSKISVGQRVGAAAYCLGQKEVVCAARQMKPKPRGDIDGRQRREAEPRGRARSELGHIGHGWVTGRAE